ncbi:thylakoid membrane protein TERC, chloroplastic isoform X2 [Momordica charantia]|uniref:Thylakoid membrane protein TERC, chloroplastic isoform X2 n=1 Tax=Momordica charantia TaxID=3673 RepID=A0A6J1CQ88_MOMCH|nr:thylakoid membrane protein TERC, chloroplastic isoform X2 [Momordica charantia]
MASIIHNAIQISSKPDSPWPKVSSQLHFQPRTWIEFVHNHIPRFSPVVLNCHRAPRSLIRCGSRIEKEGDPSTAEANRSQSSGEKEYNRTYSVSGTTEGFESKVSSVRNVALCVATAVAFGIGLGLKDGPGKASEFYAGYLLEQSLSVDNLFVFVLIFKYFKVPIEYQNRVLTYGISGAIVFRLTIILLGTATLQRFEAVNLLLAAILLYSSFQLFGSEEEDDTDLSDNFVVKMCQKLIPVTANYDGNHFFTLQDGVKKATPLLLTVAVIELSDIAFAVDSIPAVFGVTRDPFIVFTSNFFAILGLRSLFVLIADGMSELKYLQAKGPFVEVLKSVRVCKVGFSRLLALFWPLLGVR